MGCARNRGMRNRLSQCVTKLTKKLNFTDLFLFRINRNGILHQNRVQIAQNQGSNLVKTTVFNISPLFFFFFFA